MRSNLPDYSRNPHEQEDSLIQYYEEPHKSGYIKKYLLTYLGSNPQMSHLSPKRKRLFLSLEPHVSHLKRHFQRPQFLTMA